MDLWFSEHHTKNVRLQIKVNKHLFSGESEYQRIDVFESYEFGRFLTLDGYMMLTEKDEFIYHEMITHDPFPPLHVLIPKIIANIHAGCIDKKGTGVYPSQGTVVRLFHRLSKSIPLVYCCTLYKHRRQLY
jgi:hypothetical protein